MISEPAYRQAGTTNYKEVIQIFVTNFIFPLDKGGWGIIIPNNNIKY